ncbi:MAG: hypothetical protein GY777_08720 [Candidatus Brocadiaceae bacterium]|nr:hypothetical protein [Candidatus Brocadiaceae bacterium]
MKLQLRASRGNKEAKESIKHFTKWLRKNYDFPVPLSVNLLPAETFITMNGDEVVGSFRWFDDDRKPYIRLATGDYPDLCEELGEEAAIDSVLETYARQIIRYQNWCKTGKCTDRGVNTKSTKMLQKYKEANKV